MPTIEEQYRLQLQILIDSGVDRDSEEYATAKQELWEGYESALFEKQGNLSLIHRAQSRFANEYFSLVKSFYQGEITDSAYRNRRLYLLRNYARRLYKNGLLTGVFDDAWIADFLRDSLAEERRLLPVPRNRDKFTSVESDILCDPLREFSKQFFRAVHTDFGVIKLASGPEIFGGVVGALRSIEDAEKMEEYRAELEAKKVEEYEAKIEK